MSKKSYNVYINDKKGLCSIRTTKKKIITYTSIGQKLKKDARSSIIAFYLFSLLCLILTWSVYLMARGESIIIDIIFACVGAGWLSARMYEFGNKVRIFRAVSSGHYTVSEDIFGEVEPQLKPWHLRTQQTGSYEFVFLFISRKKHVVDNYVPNLSEYAPSQHRKAHIFRRNDLRIDFLL